MPPALARPLQAGQAPIPTMIEALVRPQRRPALGLEPEARAMGPLGP